MSAWIVNAAGFALAALIVWWFWLSVPRALRAATGGVIDVLVDNGVYNPARIEVPAGQAVTLRFLRKDASPCAEKVLFSDLETSADLPIDQAVSVTVTPPHPGEFSFTCQMKMYRGTLIAR